MSWSFDKEAEDLHRKLMTLKEDITIDEFYQKYASKKFLKAAKKEHERLKALNAVGVCE